MGSNFGGARIFLEGPRSLVPLFSVEDGAPTQLVRCFQSRGGQAALYVEAASSKTDFTKEVASLTYDLEALPRGGAAYDPTEGACYVWINSGLNIFFRSLQYPSCSRRSSPCIELEGSCSVH